MTPRQLKILDFVRDCGCSPTIHLVAAFTGLTYAQARSDIADLIREGVLERGPKPAKELRLRRQGGMLFAASATGMLSELRRRGILAPGAPYTVPLPKWAGLYGISGVGFIDRSAAAARRAVETRTRTARIADKLDRSSTGSKA